MKKHLITITLSNDAFKQLSDGATLVSRANKLASQKAQQIVEEYLNRSAPKASDPIAEPARQETPSQTEPIKQKRVKKTK